MTDSEVIYNLSCNPDDRVFNIDPYTVHRYANGMYAIKRSGVDGMFLVSAHDPYEAVDTLETFSNKPESRQKVVDNW